MKIRSLKSITKNSAARSLLLASVGAVILLGFLQAKATVQPTNELNTINFADLVWFPIDPNNPRGVSMATLWGDPRSSAYGALLKVPAGFESPPHTHSADEHIVQISGSSIHWSAEKNRDSGVYLKQGDYFFVAADIAHVSATGTEESIELITQSSAFDFSFAQ